MVVQLVEKLVYVATATNMLSIVTRDEWGAKPPKNVVPIEGPVPFVIIHHSYQPAACYTNETCIKAMQSMQSFHQNDRKWDDIGYNFGIGGDGRVYQGRGFNVHGAHAPPYNNRSIGICLIGDWRTELPPIEMLEATKNLIAYAIENNYLAANYTLYGHRQARNTECPGERLFNEIRTWDHFRTVDKTGASSPNSIPI